MPPAAPPPLPIPGTPAELRAEAARLDALYWRPYRPSAWRWRRWPMLLAFLLTALCTLLPLRAALLPDYAPAFDDLPQSVRDHAALLWLLCWIPALSYTLASQSERRPIPFFPIIGVLYGLYYALPAVMGLVNYWGRDPVAGTGMTTIFDPRVEYTHPVDMALLGWIACLFGRYLATRGWRPALPAINDRLRRLRTATLIPWAFTFVALGGVLAVLHRISPFDPSNIAAARMVNYLSHTGIIVLVVCYRRKVLTLRQRIATWVLVPATAYLDLGAGATAKVLYIAFAIFVALWIGRRGLLFRHAIAGALVVLLCISIRGVMERWRYEVWWGGNDVPAMEQSRVLIRLLGESVRDRGVRGTISHGWEVVARRSSNIELLADVMRRTPAEVPYWDGFTYQSLVGAMVPRVLWPDKPTKTLGQDFGHRYAYLNPWDEQTSLNLPVLVEFYINFGDLGILFGMLVVGVIFGVLEQLCNRPGQSTLVTAAAAPILTQLFVMECDLSLQYGGLILQLSALVVLGVVLAALHDPRRRIPWWERAPTLQVPRLYW